jgi:hypothetical protein
MNSVSAIASSGSAQVLLLAFAIMLGLAAIDLKRSLARLTRSVNSLRGPRIFAPAGGMTLPALDAVSAKSLRSVTWQDFFPTGVGMVVVLDPDKEDCWRIGVEIGHYKKDWTRRPMLVLIMGDVRQALRFIRKAALPEELVGLAGDWDGLGSRVLPHALALRGDSIVAAAHIVEMAQVQTFEASLPDFHDWPPLGDSTKSFDRNNKSA